MKQQSSLARLWSYLKASLFVFFAVFENSHVIMRLSSHSYWGLHHY